MTDQDQPVTVGLFLKMLEAHDRQLVFDIVEALSGRAVGSRNRDDGLDPQFVAAREAVRKSIANPLVSLGDPGHRVADGIHALPLNKVADPDTDDERFGPAQRAIAARRRRVRGGDHAPVRLADAGDVRPLQRDRRAGSRARCGEAVRRERYRTETEGPFYRVPVDAKLRRSNIAGPSSNGRTPDFGSGYGGSNPPGPIPTDSPHVS